MKIQNNDLRPATDDQLPFTNYVMKDDKYETYDQRPECIKIKKGIIKVLASPVFYESLKKDLGNVAINN